MVQTLRLDFMCELGNNQEVGTNNQAGKNKKVHMCLKPLDSKTIFFFF